MNVTFHVLTGLGIATMLVNTDTVKAVTVNEKLPIALTAFAVGIVSHGVLDYIPHCYPIHSKADVIFGSILIGILIYLTHRKYRLLIGLSFVGTIFPDIVDLSPAILNKYLGLQLPVLNKIFPWHWPEYSGSLYNTDCSVSIFNHVILLLTIAVLFFCRLNDLKTLFKRQHEKI